MRIASRKVQISAAAAAALLMALTACSSSGGNSGSSSGNSGSTSSAGSGTAKAAGSTITVGVINDTTGPASSGFQSTEKGVKAYVDAVNAAGGVNGHKIKYIMADSTSSPTGALTAAQKLVQNDHVFAIVSVTSYMFGAEPYLLKEGVPVLGSGFDGPEWNDPKNTNMFNVIGAYDPASAFTTYGKEVKKLGGTRCGAIGYIESPSASGSAKAFGTSCKAAGLQSVYTNNVHFGDTNVGPIALGMKSKRVDAVETSVQPATSFALAAALKQNNVPVKAVFLPIGYGSDLLKSPPAVRSAQGFYFTTQQQPVEMNTAATKVEVQRLAAAGEHQPPGNNETVPYLSFAALARGLKEAGASPTPQSFMAALRKVKDFDGEGLLAPNKVNFSDYHPTRQCTWLVRLEGKKFVPVTGLSPVCGTLIKS